MAQPTPYERQASFSNLQAQAPSDPPPGSTLDAEFNAVKETIDEALANLALIQRDDGELASESVGYEQLSTELSVGINRWEPWVTATYFDVGDTVFRTSAVYRAAVAHTAGMFSTDLAAGKWTLILDLATLTLATASNIAYVPTGSIAATTVQAAINELDSEKAATSHTHPSSAITDSTAAGRAMLTAANVAAQQVLLGLGDLAFEDSVPVSDIGAQLAFTGIIEPAALGASVNDWAPTGIATCSTIRASASAAGVQITGIVAPAVDGTIKIIENVGATHLLTIARESASSAAANRFLTPTAIVIPPNSAKVFKYDLDGSTPRWRLLDNVAPLPRGYIDGCTLSNGTDATNDINIAAGVCRDSTDTVNITVAAMSGKQLDVGWAPGGSAGMRNSAAAIADGTYHIYSVAKADGTQDIYAHTSTTVATVLTALQAESGGSSYLYARRIGSILREGATIIAFTQTGDYFERVTAKNDINVTNPGTSAVNRTLSVPLGLVVLADLFFSASQTSTSQSSYALLTAISSTDSTPSLTMSNMNFSLPSGSTGSPGVVPVQIMTNTSGAIRSRLSTSDASTTLSITTRGWTDTRGKG